MNHHPAFSTQVRNQGIIKPAAHGAVCPSGIHAESVLAAKNKGLLHDTAFLAERGCLGSVRLPGHAGPAHLH